MAVLDQPVVRSALPRLKVIMKPNGNGELTPLLCDASGEPLPGQTRVDIYTAFDDVARVTVEFQAIEFGVDGGDQPIEPAFGGNAQLCVAKPEQVMTHRSK